MDRDYKREYETFHGKPEERKRRAARNKARRYMERNGRAHKGDGKDVDHKNHNAEDNRPSNLRVIDRSANRSDN